MTDFVQFAEERGLIINSLESGRWVRVPTVDHSHKRNGAYWFGGDYGHVQNWAVMDKAETWLLNKPRTPFEQSEMQIRMKASRDAYAKERAAKQRESARKAEWILSQCELDIHAYLDSKWFPKMKGNVWRKPDCDPLLVVPMYFNNSLCGCQLIGIDGTKKFLTGQRTNDAYFKIGQSGKKILCEGYATALSINAILAAAKVPATVYATFSVGNASRLAKTFPDAFWIADNDKSGAGQKAASESGLKWWMPPDEGTDANDWHQSVGLFRAAMELKKVVAFRN